MKQVYPISIEGGPSSTGSYILMLEEPESGRRIPIVIGEYEAHAILIAKGMVNTGRPMTHRLMVDLTRTSTAAQLTLSHSRFSATHHYMWTTAYLMNAALPPLQHKRCRKCLP